LKRNSRRVDSETEDPVPKEAVVTGYQALGHHPFGRLA
jgi:hypothetical protein